jgi:hypothetical protein
LGLAKAGRKAISLDRLPLAHLEGSLEGVAKLSKEFIEMILWQVFEVLQNQKPPTVRYDKKRKTISLKYGFNHNTIPAKVIAPREVWLEFWNHLDLDQIQFETIEPYFSPK